MAAERGAAGPGAKTAKAASRQVAEPEAGAARKQAGKLSFKDKHALAKLPATIARLEAEAARLRADLADPDLYSRDRAAFEKASADFQDVAAQLAAAEDEWLRIEALREELEGA